MSCGEGAASVKAGPGSRPSIVRSSGIWPPANTTQTYDLDGTGTAHQADVTLGFNEGTDLVDFGYQPTGTAAIQGNLYEDLNSNDDFDDGTDADIDAVHLDTGERKTVYRGASWARYLPTGHLLLGRDGALDAAGEVVGEFPEQVPYLEWKHSGYAGDQSCQDCHMPEVEAAVPIASVLGEPRENVSRHVFRGGNVFMLNMLNRYRDELGVTTPAADLEQSARETLAHLQAKSSRVEVGGVAIADGTAKAQITRLSMRKRFISKPPRR